jgi:hypothetical protein
MSRSSSVSREEEREAKKKYKSAIDLKKIISHYFPELKKNLVR